MVEDAAVAVVEKGAFAKVGCVLFAREIDKENEQDFMTIRLPNYRKLYYAHPFLDVNQWNNKSVAYMGMDQSTKQWKRIETYGGKLVENIVQAIARDCLAEAIERLEAASYAVVMHVHDEVVIECPAHMADLDAVVAIMAQPVSWAPDLPMAADGWIGEFYKKG